MSTDMTIYKSIINHILIDLIFCNPYSQVEIVSTNIYSILDWFEEHGIKLHFENGIDINTIIIYQVRDLAISDKLFTYTNSLTYQMSKTNYEERLIYDMQYNVYPKQFMSTQFIDIDTIKYVETILADYNMITQTDEYITIIGFNADVLPIFTLDNICDNVLVDNVINFMFRGITYYTFDPNISFLENLIKQMYHIIMEILCSWVVSCRYSTTCSIFNIMMQSVFTDIGIKINHNTNTISDIADHSFVLGDLNIVDYIDNIRRLVIEKLEHNFTNYVDKYGIISPNSCHIHVNYNSPIHTKIKQLLESMSCHVISVTNFGDTIGIIVKKLDQYIILCDDIILS